MCFSWLNLWWWRIHFLSLCFDVLFMDGVLGVLELTSWFSLIGTQGSGGDPSVGFPGAHSFSLVTGNSRVVPCRESIREKWWLEISLPPHPWSEVKWSEVAQSCLTLCEPMGCSLPGSSVHGIFQAIVLEWIAISFSGGSSQSRERTRVSHTVDRRFTVWATAPLLLHLDTGFLNTHVSMGGEVRVGTMNTSGFGHQ